MKDAIGQDIELGDRVVHVYGSRRPYIHDGYCVGFTAKMVRHDKSAYGIGSVVNPRRCIVIKKGTEE